MSTHYNDIGKLQLVVPASDYNITALNTGNVLFDTVRGTTYIIVNTKCDTTENRITANGFTANWILNKRCIANKYTLTNLESGVYEIINDNLRGLPRVTTASPEGLTEETNTILDGGQILDEIKPFLEEAQLGNKMIWDPDALSHTFKIYKGADLTEGIHAVVFSDEQGTAKDLVINDDDSTFKNFAYVKGTLNDGTEFVETVGTATGEDRREIWFDTSVSQEMDESVEDCKARAVAYATMELGKRISRQSFSVIIDPSELGTLYNIGDVVSCVSIRFGVSFNARITGVKYRLDATGEKTEIILGEPKLTVIDEVKITTRIPVKPSASGNANVPVYKGAYTVVPSTSDQTLETAGMMMEQDTLIEKIPFSVVSNAMGGSTVTIG
jgi:hypothetical protein